MLKRGDNYEQVRGRFRWAIPARYNMGVDVCDKHAASTPDAPALLCLDADLKLETYSFRMLQRLSNKLANLYQANGLAREDRVAILLPQAPETAIAHIAAYKAGLIAVPLFILFGEDALEYRLQTSGAKALILGAESLEKIANIRDRLPELELVLSIDGPSDKVQDFHAALEAASDRFTPLATAPNDPALLVFTSGTTGPPKGALHAHRTLLGHLPGVEFPQEFFPQKGDLFWTPADWAWVGGLIDVLLPSLHHGIPVLAYRARKFDPEETFRLMADHRVRNAFMPPTALKLMRQVPDPRARWNYAMRSIGSGGETLGTELLDWGRDTFGLTINEFYGQTECNLVVGNCASIMPVRPGSMGRAIPGHTVGIIDEDGNELPDGEVGSIAIKQPDPVAFLGYWNNPEATQEKFAGDWLKTGDLGTRDDDGYFWYVGRDDDVITSAGYRIGPGEIEDCLMTHPAVALAAVVGVPDPIRTQAIKAYIVLRDDTENSDGLTQDIQDFVKTRLAAHEYPRLIEFLDELPMTTTGKIMRRELRARDEA
ncbi:MAG: AMP-binding protein [Alphaproteobacteria bacterium]|nr:AMP-binding protein [Alphaproteobacteria bacterium]